MPRVRFPCFTIVAAFHLLAASASAQVVADVPVPAAAVDLARTYGLDPTVSRATFLPEFIRLLYAQQVESPATRAMASAGRARTTVPTPPSAVVVPVPLTADTWGRAVFERAVPPSNLLPAIVGDRRAALLAYGLFGIDDPTLEYLSKTPAVLRRVYQSAAPAFAAFGETVRVSGGRVQVPGGEAAAPLWEAVVGQSVTQPERFVPALFELERGRIAYLYDLVARLDAPRAAFVLGSWIPDAAERRLRFAALVRAAASAYEEWRIEEAPFTRASSDLGLLLTRLRVEPSGAPSPPATRAFWTAVFATDDVLTAPPLVIALGGPSIDAAWLLQEAGVPSMSGRSDRIDQVALVSRMFSGAAANDLPDVVLTARASRRYRALIVALERMGMRSPAVYVSAVRQAASIPVREPEDTFWRHAAFQGALAMLVRLSSVNAIDAHRAQQLTSTLCATAADETGRGVIDWLRTTLLAPLPAGSDAEARLMAALAGARSSTVSRVEWEGESYTPDLAAAEIERLRRVRARQSSYTVDLALELDDARRLIRADDAASLEAAAAALVGLSDRRRAVMARPTPTVAAPGVVPMTDLPARLQAVVATLRGTALAPNRAARADEALTAIVKVVLGEALVSMAYALDIGDPTGTALLGRNVAVRHDFGFTHLDRELRTRLPWTLPVQQAQPGTAWHITGSLIGLDLALAPMALRRMDEDPIPVAPKLPSGEREAFALSVALLNPYKLRDADRDAIVAAIGRGRQRVAGLASRAETLDAIAQELSLGGHRRRVLAWTLAKSPQSAERAFSLAELLTLGQVPAEVDLDSWGTSAVVLSGCVCTDFVDASVRRLLDGRTQSGLLASSLSDLNLHIALELHALGMPALLAKQVLAHAVLEFIETVAPVDALDWWTLARTAQATPRTRIEDYISTATAVGGALVPHAMSSEPGQ